MPPLLALHTFFFFQFISQLYNNYGYADNLAVSKSHCKASAHQVWVLISSANPVFAFHWTGNSSLPFFAPHLQSLPSGTGAFVLMFVVSFLKNPSLSIRFGSFYQTLLSSTSTWKSCAPFPWQSAFPRLAATIDQAEHWSTMLWPMQSSTE